MADLNQHSWQEIVLRMQQVGNHAGLCLVSITAIIKDGQLVGWLKPRESRFEPATDSAQLLEALCNGEHLTR
jgi:hypothetical protein